MNPGMALPAVALAAVALAWFWRPPGPIGRHARLLLALYGVLGAWTLAATLVADPGTEPDFFAHCKPTLVYWSLFALLMLAPSIGWDFPAKLLIGTYFVVSRREWGWINLALALLCLVLGAVNLEMAFHHNAHEWNDFKWCCMVNLDALLLLRMAFVWVDIGARAFRTLAAWRRQPLP